MLTQEAPGTGLAERLPGAGFQRQRIETFSRT